VASPRHRLRGLTLIELMISITLGLVVLAALSTVFVNSARSNAALAARTAQIDSGRSAIWVLQDNIANAGFWDGFTPTYDNFTISTAPSDAPTGIADPCQAFSALTWTNAYKTNLIGHAILASDASIGSCSSVITDRVAATDVLVVRHAERCTTGSSNCDADTTGMVYFTASRCPTTTTSYVLGTSSHADMLQKDCTTAITTKRALVSNLYYVRSYMSTVGDGIPTLVRSQLQVSGGTMVAGTATALIEGVEQFRVELGVDSISKSGESVSVTQAISWDDPSTKVTAKNRGDGVPDGDFVRCTTASPCSADTLTNVVAVRVGLLTKAQSTSKEVVGSRTYVIAGATLGPYTDGYRRDAYTSTIRLHNVAGRRETP
jgi:type IV pilus assembly protein PilW